jgi:hypothetical protein
LKSTGFLRIFCVSTKWIATLFALIGLVVAALFSYDLMTHDRWGYPWWLLPILVGIALVAWLLRREAVIMLEQIVEQEP